jgi:N6-adenosine-specific RNA methylase IME4
VLLTYRVIMADPPWQYSNPRALVGNGGRGIDGGRVKQMTQVDVESHYSTLSVAQISAIPVADLADSTGCMLFLWVTNPFLVDGSGPAVLKAWGFKPKSVLTWAKTQSDDETPSMKTGHWFRSASEHCLVGIRGKLQRPSTFPPLPTWQPHRRIGRHSAKPCVFHEYAEKAVPEGPWLELFARGVRDGWDAWGNQTSNSIDWSPFT